MAVAKQMPVDDRNSERAAILRLGVMEADGDQQHFHLLNLSRPGAHLYCAAPPRLETFGSLDCGPLACSGTVVWAARYRIGIAFSHPIDDHMIEEVVAGTARRNMVA